jgi:hypothetical protein
MALVCVSLATAAGGAFAPPDAYLSAWFALAGLVVAVPASLAYERLGGTVRALWWYVLTVFVGSVVVAFLVVPFAILLDAARLLRGPFGPVATLAVHAAAFVLVYRGGWATLRRWFVTAVRRRPDER